MGVNLRELIQAKEISLEDLSGKTIAIDAYNTIFQFLSIIRDRFTGEPLRDSKGSVTSHLSGLFYRTSRMIEFGISPVYIFDGEPPAFKAAVVEERARIRKEAEVKWKEAVKAGDIEKVRQYAQGASRLTGEMIEESEKLLSSMGVPHVQAPSEGEAQASYLVKKGLAYATGSQDWDSLLFGSPRLVKNLSISGRRKVPRKEKYVSINPELIELKSALSHLGINHEQLILIGILVGTDYNPGGVKGFGPKKAFEFVKEKKTLENISKDIEWEFAVPLEEIFNFFVKPPVRDIEIKKPAFDIDKLREILIEHDFSEERIGGTLQKLQKARSKEGQSRLGRFFG